MGEFVATYILPTLAWITYALQLCTGIAVSGVSGDSVLVDRRIKPGPYWFIMALQTVVLLGGSIFFWMAV